MVAVAVPRIGVPQWTKIPVQSGDLFVNVKELIQPQLFLQLFQRKKYGNHHHVIKEQYGTRHEPQSHSPHSPTAIPHPWSLCENSSKNFGVFLALSQLSDCSNSWGR